MDVGRDLAEDEGAGRRGGQLERARRDEAGGAAGDKHLLTWCWASSEQDEAVAGKGRAKARRDRGGLDEPGGEKDEQHEARERLEWPVRSWRACRGAKVEVDDLYLDLERVGSFHARFLAGRHRAQGPGQEVGMTTPTHQHGPLVTRRWTRPGERAYDLVSFHTRDALIGDPASPTFFQAGVEVPEDWGDNAVAILASKYFRGALRSPEREHSLRQVVDRIVDTITDVGVREGYFLAGEEAESFREELKYLLITQKAAFNSPVWFNIGVPGAAQQASACYILSVEDSIDSIAEWIGTEARIFKNGSGSGVNLSALRAAGEPVTGGGRASGPISFMRGADASAGAIRSGGKTRRAAKMVVLDVDHPDIEEFVWAKVREEQKIRALAAAGFDMGLDGVDITSVQFQNANNSVRLPDAFMEAVEAGEEFALRARTSGEVTRTVSARELFSKIAEAAWECADPGVQFDTTINNWHTRPASGRINASNPCGEFLSLDDTSCNLSSINLLAFMDDDGRLMVEDFCHAVRVLICAQDILVAFADYPTERIGKNARAYRELGLGYANLGAALMAKGLAYDSDEGRDFAAAVTALMTGEAYATSGLLAARVGRFVALPGDYEAMDKVLHQHLGALEGLRRCLEVSSERAEELELCRRAAQAFTAAIEAQGTTGVRNSQVSVIAPTGTISFLMGCDTTGVEPAIALVATKSLVGGGTMTLVVDTLARGLSALGYAEDTRRTICDHVAATGDVTGAPGLKPEHVAVFATAIGKNAIAPMGHVKMVAAIQPFLSGGVSKTVNLPASASVEDIEEIYFQGWKLGCKCLSVYRDGCKAAQPLHAGRREDTEAPAETASSPVPYRRRLPRRRESRTTAFDVGGMEGYLTVGHYEDGRPGEVFIKVSKQGSTLSGVMDCFAMAVSVGLQYGVPLATFVRKYTHTRFEPSGITDDAEVRKAESLVDYVFTRLALDYLDEDERAELGVFSVEERKDALATKPTAGGHAKAVAASVTTDFDEPICPSCGSLMQRTGTCFACPACGTSGGC